MFIACTVGSSGPAHPGSQSATEAKAMADVAAIAGEMANRARELEAATASSRNAIDAGGNKLTEQEKINQIMDDLLQMNATLQDEHAALEQRLKLKGQSTDATNE
jgi:membrane-bound ClpP family serine protease